MTSKVSVPLIGDFVFNKMKTVLTPEAVAEVSVPLIGDFVFNATYNLDVNQVVAEFPSP